MKLASMIHTTINRTRHTVLMALGLVIALNLTAQDSIVVSGVVKNSSGDVIPNVSVSMEGSTRLPVVTDAEGRFEIIPESRDAWLIVSPATGYKRRRINLNRREELTIILTPNDLKSGDDPLLLFAAQVPRRNLVPAHTEIDVTEMYQSSSLSVDQFMQARTPGMYVVNRSGMPGSGAVTSLRGVNSINATNMPLYIVDGIPQISHGLFDSNLAGYAYNGLMGINSFDISRATVYKDAAVESVFGSKGSNGIIFLETLDPSATQTSIELNFRTGYSLAPTNQIPQMNAGQHNTLMNEVLFSTGTFEEDLREFYPTLFMEEDDPRYIDYQHNTNWQDYIFNNAFFYNINIKVKGGDEIARYGLSFGYLDSDGIIESTGFQGYNLRFVSRLNIFTWLKMDAGVSLNYNSSNLKESAVVKETSPIMTALAKSPLLNPFQYDLEGRELEILANVDEIGVSNPLATIENYEAFNNNYSFTSMLGLEGTINRDFAVVSQFSFTYDVLKEQIFQPNLGMELYYNDEAMNVSKATNNDLTSLYNNTYLKYIKSFGNNHQLSSRTGMYLMNNRYQNDWGLTKNAHENDQYRDLQDGINNLREIGGDNRLWNWVSFYENLTYAYRDKYFVNATINVDGSSLIGDDAANTIRMGNIPFGLFYAGGVAWRISGEPFLRNISWLEDLRIRFTYGKSGNDDIGVASATNYYEAAKFRETVGLFPALLYNDQLTYETVTMMNGGLNLSLFGNRFTVDFDYFVSETNDMMIFSPVESYLGYDYLIENGGSMQNTGWEVGTFLRLINTNSFKWDLQLTFSTVENEVTSIKGDQLIYAVPGAEKVNKTGYPANSFYGYVYEGVYATEAEALEAGLLNNRGIPYGAGDARYADLSGPGPDGAPDGRIDEYDKTIIGNPLPDYYGGVINSFSFKGFTLSAFLQVSSGQEVFNYVRYQNEKMTGLENQSQHVLNRWQYEGQQTDVPRALWDDPMGNSDFSTRWMEDGSFMRIKFIKLSYSMPSQLLMFKSAEFYASVNNIFTFTNYLGYDPEFAFSYSQMYQGIDYGLTPIPRQFIIGVTLGL
jgi:TonB-linked SusC/RagA family outer membrane protein